MKKNITLRELCREAGVTRRAVQGYERAGLLHPVGRNKYGHLLYEEGAAREASYIRFLQELGFAVKEIAALRTAPEARRREALKTRVLALEQHRQHLTELLNRAHALIHEMESKTQEDETI